jgi:hypothetical protein
MQAWITLGCCDGLTGMTLGVATKRGFDATVTWLCSCLVFGGQVVSERAERRFELQKNVPGELVVQNEDFDGRPVGFERQERESGVLFPKPIPLVMEVLVSYMEAGDDAMSKCKMYQDVSVVIASS